MVKFKETIYTHNRYISGIFCYVIKIIKLMLACKNPYRSNLIQKAALTGGKGVS